MPEVQVKVTPSEKKQDAYLFEHNPPPLTVPKRIEALFCNRTWELRKGLERMQTLAEDGGEGMVHAIHGDSRVGKSHYVRRLLLDVDRAQLPLRRFAVSANNLGTARAVLEELFNQLWREVDDFPQEQVPDGQAEILDQYREQLRVYEPLVNNPSKTFAMKRNRAVQDQALLGVRLVHPPFEVSLQTGRTDSDGQEQAEAQGPINEQELVEFVIYELDVLRWLYCERRRVLLFIDDLDLVDRDGKEGQPESDRVVDLLRKLASRSEAIVLTTIRERTMHERDKDFRDFLKLDYVGDALASEIYRRHVALFHANEEIFGKEVLDKLIRHARGQIGLLLRRCKELWTYGDKRQLSLPMTVDHLYNWLSAEIDDLQQDNRTVSFIYPVIAAVRLGNLDVELPKDVESSRLNNKWLRSIGAQRYEIDALFFEALRRKLELPR